jgi:hypothetical protein
VPAQIPGAKVSNAKPRAWDFAYWKFFGVWRFGLLEFPQIPVAALAAQEQ